MKKSLLWDLYARVYDALPACFPPYKQLLERVLSTITGHSGARPLTVLDAGCGTGNYSVALARSGHKVTAIDMSQPMLDRCAKKAHAEGLEVAVSRASLAEPLAFNDSSFDAVININALYMLDEPEDVIAEFVRVTKPGGMVITVNPQMQISLVAILRDTCRHHGYGWLLRGAPLLAVLGLFNFLIGRRLKKGTFFYWDSVRIQEALKAVGLEVISVSPAYTADTELLAVSKKPCCDGAGGGRRRSISRNRA